MQLWQVALLWAGIIFAGFLFGYVGAVIGVMRAFRR